MPDPGAQPANAADAAKDVLDVAVNDRGGVALQGAADGHDIAADLCMGPELHIAEHCDGVAIDLAVDVDIAENGHRVVAHLPGNPSVAEDRHHVPRLAFAGRRTENGHDRV